MLALSNEAASLVYVCTVLVKQMNSTVPTSWAVNFSKDLFGQVIHILPYGQQDSVTSCSSGLRHGIDKAVLKVNVSIDRREWSTVVVITFRTLNSTEFRYLCAVDLAHGCVGFKPLTCYCDVTTQIVINVTARVSLSEADIQGYITHSQTSLETRSNIQRLPPIIDVSALTLTPHKVTSDPRQRAALILKEQNVTSDTLHLPGHVQTVEVCCHDTPEPCVGHLSADNLTVSSNITCVSYGITRHTTTYLTYSYTICGLASNRRFIVLVDGRTFSATAVETTTTTTTTTGGVIETETITSFTIDGRIVVNNTTGITLYTDTGQEKSTVLVVALSVSIALLVLLLLGLMVFYICKGKRLLQNLTEMVGGSESAKIPRSAGDDVTTDHVYESVIYTDTVDVRVDVWQTDMTDSSLIKLDTSLANDEYIIPSDLV